jgi:nucleoside-diphosphate-sugar epimerase
MPVTKVVLVGATGFIGTEVLDQLIKNRYTTHIYCLTRKPLETHYSTHKKVIQVLHENFDELPDHLFERLRGWGVQGCVWAVGAPKLTQYKNTEEAQKVNIQYPVTAAEKFAKFCAVESMEAQGGKFIHPFRFVYMSGWGAEQDSNRTLWVWSESRKMKGAAEKGLFDIMAQSQVVDGKRCLEVTTLRAGIVLRKGKELGPMLAMQTTPTIAVDLLATTAMKIVLDGDVDGRKILENADCFPAEWSHINKLNI